MQRFLEILLCAGAIAICNFILNPSRPIIFPLINLNVEALKTSEWIVVCTDTKISIKAQNANVIILNEDNFESQILLFLTMWQSEKNVLIYAGSADLNYAGKLAKKLRDEYGIDKIYIMNGEFGR